MFVDTERTTLYASKRALQMSRARRFNHVLLLLTGPHTYPLVCLALIKQPTAELHDTAAVQTRQNRFTRGGTGGQEVTGAPLAGPHG